MKKTLFVLVAVATMALLNSCGGGNTYKNSEFKYSVTLPEGFVPQNQDAAMEAERGGKLFVKDGCMIDMAAKKMDYKYITAEESLKQGFEIAKSADGVSESEMKDDHYYVKSQDSFGYRVGYEMQKNGVSLNIYITYPVEKKAEFDKEIDAVLNSVAIE
ncbi:MAG: hypothetical protein II034_03380 [Muribaculaceae bacterium]|nr:hypothetical protein [Muribaculaceae bacterium]MBQ4008874.1 hypothetical protein [Muribaculaceae bacterium]